MQGAWIISVIMVLGSLTSQYAWAKSLVSEETIALQKAQTLEFTLSNSIPVIYRYIKGSEIIHITSAMAMGQAHFKGAEQVAFPYMLELAEKASQNWPKEKLRAVLEKYASGIGCQALIEMSSCSLTTLNQSFPELLAVYADILKNPSFDLQEAKLVAQRTEAALQNAHINPEAFVNEVVNSVFYPPEHPYWMPKDKELDYFKSIQHESLPALHRRWLEDSHKVIVVIGGLEVAAIKDLLESHLGALKQGRSKIIAPPVPQFSPKKSFEFAERPIPTAYVRIKYNLPGITSPEAAGLLILSRILSEDLEDEVRTKQSLSYAIYAQNLNLAMGIGVIHASTSQPEKLLLAIRKVIENVRRKPLSERDLQRYKMIFTTSYYLTLEDHSSLAFSLASTFLYFGNYQRLYDFPKELERVT